MVCALWISTGAESANITGQWYNQYIKGDGVTSQYKKGTLNLMLTNSENQLIYFESKNDMPIQEKIGLFSILFKINFKEYWPNLSQETNLSESCNEFKTKCWDK